MITTSIIAWLEWPAAILALLNIALLARRSIWNYAFGISAAILYLLVMEHAKLYTAALLQILMVVVQLFGWYNWRSFSERGDLPIQFMDWRERWIYLLGSLLLAGFWGGFMAFATDGKLPFVDALLSVASLTSQALLSTRRVEGWFVWVCVNLGAIGLFASQGLFATTILHFVLLVLSLLGLCEWMLAEKRRTFTRGSSPLRPDVAADDPAAGDYVVT